jgi:CSLREA domain-containing protein
MRRGFALAAGVLGLIAMLAIPGGASAATIKVTTTLDEFGEPGGAGCALREAVEAANSNSKFGGCKRKGSSSTDGILLRGGKTYALALPGFDDSNAQGDLDVDEKVAISVRKDGKATIDGGSLDRVIEVHEGKLSGSALMVTGGLLTTPGQHGAGILSHGRLELRRSLVTGNIINEPGGSGSGGGLLTDGPTTLDRVVVKDNHVDDLGSGGGVASLSGRFGATNSSFAGNTAHDGAGIYIAGGKAAVRSSTISGNTADGESTGGGGVLIVAGLDPRRHRLTNVTISGNSSNTRGGGVFLSSGELAVNAATVAGNTADANTNGAGTVGGAGGGLHGNIPFRNSLIFGNSATTPSSQDCYEAVATGGNLSGMDTGCGAQHETSDALLGPLAMNGGPTKTHELLRGSPAIGKAGKKSAPKRDQRGVKRDKKPDIGAYER